MIDWNKIEASEGGIDGYTGSQLDPSLLNTNALNPFIAHTSGSRAQMAGAQAPQVVPLITSDTFRISTGIEYEFGKHCHDVRMPRTGYIRAVLQRGGVGSQSSETVVIYQSEEDGQYDCFTISGYGSGAGGFAWQYRPGEAHSRLYIGGYIEEDEVICRNSSVGEQGDYTPSRRILMASCSHPFGTEDAIGVSESFIKKFAYRMREVYRVRWDDSDIPLNTYGGETGFRIFPEIGEAVREDGVLMAIRTTDQSSTSRGLSYDPLGPVQLSAKALSRINPITDEVVYAKPGARIVDIVVHHDGQAREVTPMEEQPLRHHRANVAFYRTLLGYYRRWIQEAGCDIIVGPSLNSLLVEAPAVTAPARGPDRVALVYKQEPISYSATITVVSVCYPGMGSKFTGLYSDKGVVSAIVPDEQMPVDQFGRRVEMIVDTAAIINRMIPGRAYHGYMSDYAMQIEGAIRNMPRNNREQRLAAFQLIMKAYATVYPPLQEEHDRGRFIGKEDDILDFVLMHGLDLYSPTDTPIQIKEVLNSIQASQWVPLMGPLTFTLPDGTQTTTVYPIRAAEAPILMLNKVADAHSNNTSCLPRTHSWGHIADAAEGVRSRSGPARTVPCRLGQAETTIGATFCDPRLIAELIDRSCSMESLESQGNTLLRSTDFGEIESLVDREKIPLGNSAPLRMVEHIMRTAGVRYEHEPFDPNARMPK